MTEFYITGEQICTSNEPSENAYSVYSDVKEAVKELLDLKFKILPVLEDVACGRKHRRKIEKDGEA